MILGLIVFSKCIELMCWSIRDSFAAKEPEHSAERNRITRIVAIDTGHNGRLVGAVFRGEICQSVIGRGCEDGHRPVATAGDGDPRRYLSERFGGDEGGEVRAGREVKET